MVKGDENVYERMTRALMYARLPGYEGASFDKRKGLTTYAFDAKKHTSAVRKKFAKIIQTHNGEFDKSIEEGFASDAQRRAAFASGYEAKGKKKKNEEYFKPIPSGEPVEFEPAPTVRRPAIGKFKAGPKDILDVLKDRLTISPTDILRRPVGDIRPAPGVKGIGRPAIDLVLNPLPTERPEQVPPPPTDPYAGIPEEEVEEGLRQAMSGPRETESQKRKRMEKDNFDLYKKRQGRIAALRGDKSSRKLTAKQQRDYLKRVNLDQIRAYEEVDIQNVTASQLRAIKEAKVNRTLNNLRKGEENGK